MHPLLNQPNILRKAQIETRPEIWLVLLYWEAQDGSRDYHVYKFNCQSSEYFEGRYCRQDRELAEQRFTETLALYRPKSWFQMLCEARLRLNSTLEDEGPEDLSTDFVDAIQTVSDLIWEEYQRRLKEPPLARQIQILMPPQMCSSLTPIQLLNLKAERLEDIRTLIETELTKEDPYGRDHLL